jgi:UDPglucose--hexose-1-phosphate uridylyltransferase
MASSKSGSLSFKKQLIRTTVIVPSGEEVERVIEVRTNPITGRTSRISFSRSLQSESGIDALPAPPPEAEDTAHCPFCGPHVEARTPRLATHFSSSGHLVRGDSVLFPNLFPYGTHSAVGLFDNNHFVEIGKASAASYAACFMNCGEYLRRVCASNPGVRYLAITQNHLPSAGGSLVHPHLQVHADAIPSNHHRFLRKKASRYFRDNGSHLFSEYLRQEKEEGTRYVGRTGRWEWVAAFAPEGFFELWGILPQARSLCEVPESGWQDLAQGVINTQRFYRSLFRNGYNLGVVSCEEASSCLELRAVIMVRSNYAPWARNDRTGYEVMLGDMCTFIAPETTAEKARPFWTKEE